MESSTEPSISALSLTTSSKSDRLGDRNGFTTINEDFELRNVIIGGLGILVNSLAFFVIFTSRQVLQGRKLILLNLITSDVMLLLCLIVYGTESSTKTSGGKGCTPVIFTILCSIMTSYLATFELSFLNFLAAYKPFEFQRLMNVKNTGIAMALAWLLSVGLCVWWIILSPFPSGFTCAPIVITPRSGLLGFAIVTFVSFVGVMFLNLTVVCKVNKKNKVLSGGKLHQWLFSIENQKSALKNTSDPQRSLAPLSTKTISNFRSRQRVVPQPSTSHDMRLTEQIIPGDNSYPSKDVPAKDIFTISKKTEKPIKEKTKRLVKAAPSADCCDVDIEMSLRYPSQTATQARQCVYVPRANIKNCPHLMRSHLEDELPRRQNYRSFPSMSTTYKENRITKTLLILTTYSGFLTIPFVIYFLCIGTDIIDDPEKMVSTPLGIFISSCPTTKACVNPFFYVLNFVNWRVLKNKIKRKMKI